MGKGDKKSKKGKLFQGSFGNNRPKKKHNLATQPAKKAVAVTATVAAEKPAAKKAAKKKAE